MAAPAKYVVPHLVEFDPQTREAFLTIEDYLAQLQAGIDAAGGSGGGVTDHGALTGLADDDHTQYLRPAEVLAGDNISIADNGDGTISVIAAASVTTLDQLADVNDSGKTTDTVLVFDPTVGQTGMWVPKVLELDDLSDVAVSPTPNHHTVLTYDSSTSQWIDYDPFAIIDAGSALAAEVLTTDTTGRGRVYYGTPDPASVPGLLPSDGDLYFATIQLKGAGTVTAPPTGTPVVTVT